MMGGRQAGARRESENLKAEGASWEVEESELEGHEDKQAKRGAIDEVAIGTGSVQTTTVLIKADPSPARHSWPSLQLPSCD